MSDENETEASHGRPYHWFQGASVQELYDRLGRYGPSEAILKVHQHGDAMYFSVDGDDDPPINDSRLCPPICP